MKKKNKTRLLKLARHLNDFHLKELLMNDLSDYQEEKGDNNIECFYWTLVEFPNIFSEWDRDDNGIPYLRGYRNLNSLTAAAIYFGLDMDSLFHLFVSDYQMPKFYYGKRLSANSTPSDLANNIYEYLRYIEESEVSWEKFDNAMRTIFLNPIKNKNHERNKNKLPKMCA